MAAVFPVVGSGAFDTIPVLLRRFYSTTVVAEVER